MADTQTYLSVSEITQEIKSSLEDRYEWVQVKGEISNFKKSPTGHAYFKLKDKNAVLESVAWRSTVVRWSGLDLEDGVEVIAGGRITVYPPRGQYQLVVSAIRLAGIGALQQRFEELKAKLLQKGYFETERKRPLPEWPTTIAVITSEHGAALQDFLKVLNNRCCPINTTICPVLVQGVESAQQIASMIKQVNQQKCFDLIVLCRGGGSMEDLWSFNEEAVADAIYHSSIPVLTGIGHEVDFTIADFVADYRAPTPTGAAQVICDIFDQKRAQFQLFLDRFKRTVYPKIQRERERLETAKRTLQRSHPGVLLSVHRQKLDDITVRLVRHAQLYKLARRDDLSQKQSILRKQLLFVKRDAKREFLRRKSLLESYDPTRILKRGYAICRTKNGEIIKSSDQPKIDDSISIQLGQGQIESIVTKKLS